MTSHFVKPEIFLKPATEKSTLVSVTKPLLWDQELQEPGQSPTMSVPQQNLQCQVAPCPSPKSFINPLRFYSLSKVFFTLEVPEMSCP